MSFFRADDAVWWQAGSVESLLTSSAYCRLAHEGCMPMLSKHVSEVGTEYLIYGAVIWLLVAPLIISHFLWLAHRFHARRDTCDLLV